MAIVRDSYDDELADIQFPTARRLNFTKLDITDVWWLGAGLGLAYIQGKLVSPLHGWACVLLWLVSMVRGNDGRAYYMGYVISESAWIDRVRKGRLWKTPQPTTSAVSAVREAKEAKAKARALPLNVWELPLEVNDRPTVADDESEVLVPKSMGIAHHKARNTDSFVIVSSGSSMLSRGPVETRRLMNRMAYLIKQAIYLPGYSVGYSFVFRRDPFDMFGSASNDASWMHPAVFMQQPLGDNPSPLDKRNYNLALNAQDRDDQLLKYSNEVWMATVVTVQRDQRLRQAERHGLRESDLPQLTVNRIARQLILGYESLGIHKPRVLDYAELHRFMRGAWDSETIQDYYRECLIRPEAGRDSDLHWYQREADAYPRFCVNDGSYTAVLRATGARRSMTDAFFRLLVSLDIPNVAFTLVSDGVKVRGDIAVIDRTIAFKEQTQKKRAAISNSIAAQRDLENTRERQRSLEAAGVNQQFNILCGVRAGNEKDLMARIQAVTEHCRLLDMPVTQVLHSSLQHPAMWSAFTGINML